MTIDLKRKNRHLMIRETFTLADEEMKKHRELRLNTYGTAAE